MHFELFEKYIVLLKKEIWSIFNSFYTFANELLI